MTIALATTVRNPKAVTAGKLSSVAHFADGDMARTQIVMIATRGIFKKEDENV